MYSIRLPYSLSLSFCRHTTINLFFPSSYPEFMCCLLPFPRNRIVVRIRPLSFHLFFFYLSSAYYSLSVNFIMTSIADCARSSLSLPKIRPRRGFRLKNVNAIQPQTTRRAVIKAPNCTLDNSPLTQCRISQFRPTRPRANLRKSQLPFLPNRRQRPRDEVI